MSEWAIFAMELRKLGFEVMLDKFDDEKTDAFLSILRCVENLVSFAKTQDLEKEIERLNNSAFFSVMREIEPYTSDLQDWQEIYSELMKFQELTGANLMVDDSSSATNVI